MKRLIFALILILTFACGPIYILSGNFDNYFTQEQVDSICRADHIPMNLDKWDKMLMIEDSTYFDQYLYIRSNDSLKCFWTLSDLDSIYRFKKKILKITDK